MSGLVLSRHFSMTFDENFSLLRASREPSSCYPTMALTPAIFKSKMYWIT